MDATLVYVIMVALGLLMAVLPFGVFMGVSTLLGRGSGDNSVLIIYFLGSLALGYLAALGAYALIQRSNCGSVKNLNQVATNAVLSTGIQAVTLGLIWFFPSLRGLVTGLFPPDSDPIVLDAIGYSYYAFWASLFGTAIGGTLSGICN
jgi:hypothetical protein